MTTPPTLAPTLGPYSSRRVAALVVALCLHGAILYALSSALAVAPTSAPERSVLLASIIGQTYPRAWVREPPIPKAPTLRSVAVVLDSSDLRIGFPPELLSPTTPAAQIAGPNGLSLMSNAPRVHGQPHANGEAGDEHRERQVVHQVVPDYYHLHLLPGEGSVTVRAFVDSKGNVKAVSVIRSSGSPVIDQNTLHALRRWVFAPSTTSQWVQETFVFGIDFGRVYQGAINLSILDATRTKLILASALPATRYRAKSLWGDERVRSLISKIQAVAANYSKELPYPLAVWGKVQSVEFLGSERRGLEFDTASRELVDGLQWQLYSVKQQLGTYIWLVGTNPDGDIDALEGMACLTKCLAREAQTSSSTH
jgi:TonB family protein